MPSKIVIIGAGFSGVWSALSAKRLINDHDRSADIEVTLIAPEPFLVMRPRLYETSPSELSFPLEALFESAGINFVRGYVEQIDASAHSLRLVSGSTDRSTIPYDKLILAAGSTVRKPASVPGLRDYAFDIDTQSAAVELERHLEKLSISDGMPGRETIVVCGAGFTGIEIVTELPKRVAHWKRKPRLVLVDSDHEVGSSLGSGPRPVITQATKELGIELRLGSKVASIDQCGVTLASGERIETTTVIWTAGVRASPLTQCLAEERDTWDRIYVDRCLRVPSSTDLFATGDAAAAETDDDGHYTMMSCQHAIPLGRVSGYNAAADILGEPMIEYSQPVYGCCLDLGAWGTVVTHGWDRQVKLTGDVAKKAKQYINRKLIYPPETSLEALALAHPSTDTDAGDVFQQIMQAIA